MHQSLQSIGNYITELQDLLDTHADHACRWVTGHWKTESQLVAYGIQGLHKAASFCRVEENRHGGSAVFVRTNIESTKKKEISDLSIERVIECCACEHNVNEIKFLIICVYRFPNVNLDIRLHVSDTMLSMVINKNYDVIIAGDFNIHYYQNASCYFAR
ncbi:hypothetical protein JTB14_015436 [Gonioctena quinquepunctata]|nr:hypothetical protein JTB14_015436 [Gonioctena quinquepunctata]